jgi:hypothetical protein
MHWRGKRIYIGGIHAAMGQDNRPLAAVFEKYRTLKAARCCQYAVKLSWVAEALALALAANGARMPSTADDVFADIPAQPCGWLLSGYSGLGC